MKKIFYLLTVFLLFFISSVRITYSQVNKVQTAEGDFYDLYLLVGQSNMAGRGVLETEDLTVHPRVFSLGKGDVWVQAKEPLHYDKAGRGTGPGLAFGKEMATAYPESKIGLIPAAVGGTKISYWMPGSSQGLYEEALRKARVAMRQGKLKGILWQQGESDSYRIEDVSMYKERLITLLNSFRKDLGGENIPVVLGGLGNFLKSSYYRNINTILQEVANEIPNVKFSEASTLGHIGDDLHFNSAAQRENGKNMSRAMIELLQNYSSNGNYGNILILGNLMANSTDFQQKITSRGYSIKKIAENEVDQISTTTGKTLIISGEKTLHPNARKKTDEFLRSGGNVVLTGTKAFDYSPIPHTPILVANLSNQDSYSIEKRERKTKALSLDEPTIRVGEDDTGNNALELFTSNRAMPNYMAKFALQSIRSSQRSVITFTAKGNSYMDLLALEILDSDNIRWYAFVPITSDWKKYAISMADFIPENWSDGQNEYSLLDPNKVETLCVGVNLMTVWKEKAMYLGISNIALAENSQIYYTPTAALNELRLPFFENDIKIPEWTFNPMHQSVKLSGAQNLTRENSYPFGQLSIENIEGVSYIPWTHINNPGTLSGSDAMIAYDFRNEREKRIIPIFEIVGTYPSKQVARIDIPTGGRYAGSTMTLIGMEPSSILSSDLLSSAVVDAMEFVAKKPVVSNVVINTTSGTTADSEIIPKLKLTLKNPQNQSVSGTVHINVANGLYTKEVPVAMDGASSNIIEVVPSEVPKNFPMKKFNWRVTLNVGNQVDYFEDQVDVERALLIAIRHLINTQKKYPDGRMSHHYFGDAYGARAMLAYLEYIAKNPLSLQQNLDIWNDISPEDISNSAYRFYDMLAERQLENGALPMGYQEHAPGYNVADGGQMVLSIEQSLRYVQDETKKNKYLDLIYRFADWAETFYIDSARSELIKTEYPDEYAKGNGTIGHYGLMQSGVKQIPYGPSWVGACILPVQTYLTYWNKHPNNAKQALFDSITERNLNFYINAMYSAQGYYQAEALFWALVSIEDETLKEKIIENINSTFLPYIFRGTENDMFAVGSRRTLNALPMIYYQRYIANKANIRAVLLKYIWTFGSETSSNSMDRLSAAFPKPTHGESLSAEKYAALSAIWAMELLEPNSSLFKGMMSVDAESAITLQTVKEGNTIGLSIRATNNLPENEAKVWIDLNNNGIIDAGEKVNKFGEKVNYVFGSDQIDIYGPIWVFDCSENEISKLTINTASLTLNQLACYKNKLDTLDLRDCTILSLVSCQNNLLQSVKVNNTPNLSRLNMFSNRLNLDAMTELVNGLPDRKNKTTGTLTLYYSVNSATQQNQNQFDYGHSQMMEAKNWKPYVAIPSGTEFTGPYTSSVTNLTGAHDYAVVAHSKNESLYINTNPPNNFSVYDIAGNLVASHFGDGVFALSNGCYIIESNNQTIKIVH